MVKGLEKLANNNVIQIMCPKLTRRRNLAVPNAARGKMVRCRGCGSTIRVPDANVEQSVLPDVDDAVDVPEKDENA